MDDNDVIAHYEEMFTYYLSNARRAREVGSRQSEESNVTKAAECAAILQELRGRA